MIDFSLMIDYLRGRSSKGYELFGAHFVWENNQSRVRFAVYAPQAKAVSLIGDFNAWNPWPMQRLDCGVWVLTSLTHSRGTGTNTASPPSRAKSGTGPIPLPSSPSCGPTPPR